MADGPPHDPLFALALARAAAYLRARPPTDGSPEAIRLALEPWALKTRFASRVDLGRLAEALAEPRHDAGRGPEDPSVP